MKHKGKIHLTVKSPLSNGETPEGREGNGKEGKGSKLRSRCWRIASRPQLIKKVVLILFLLFPLTAHSASVTLTWNPPSVSCDGSTLNDLFGYVVKWGISPGGPYPNEVDVDDATATSASVNVGDQENVTLYFVVVSRDTSGNRSDDSTGCGTSNEVQIPFGPVPPSPPSGAAGSVD